MSLTAVEVVLTSKVPVVRCLVARRLPEWIESLVCLHPRRQRRVVEGRRARNYKGVFIAFGADWQTDFAAMSADRVGLYTDGGPYMLLYAREGEGPPTPIASPKVAPVEMSEASEATAAVDDIEMADAEQSIQVVPASSEDAESVIEQGIS